MRDPDFAKWYNFAIAAYKSNNLDEALFYIEKSLHYEPKNYQALHAKGLILKKLNRFEESIKYYRLSIEYCDDIQKKEKLISIQSEIESLISSPVLDDLIEGDFTQKKTGLTVVPKNKRGQKGSDARSLFETQVHELTSKIQEMLDTSRYAESIEYIDKILDLYSDTDIIALQEEKIDQYYVAKAFALFSLGKINGLDILLKKALEINPGNFDARELSVQISNLDQEQ